MLGKAGVGNNTHVVFYGDMKSKAMDDATVAFWIFEYLGHANKAHVLNGGLEAWTKTGKKLDTQPTMKQPAVFGANVAKSRIATTEEVLKIARGLEKGRSTHRLPDEKGIRRRGRPEHTRRTDTELHDQRSA